jgi:signal transduction histidine kinase
MSDGRDRKDMLLEAGLTLSSELSLPVVLQRIVDLAAQVTDARYGALGVIGESGTLVEFVTTGISDKQRRAIGTLPAGRGVLGLLIREPKALRIKNIADHPNSVGLPPHHPPIRSFLGAPVQALGRIFGNIYLADKRSAEEFSQEDENALKVLATQAGVAIANATLYEELQTRERWLDALRDITNQVLAGTAEASLLESIAEHARQLAGAAAASIVTTTEVPGQLVVAAAAGARAPELRGKRLPAEGSISGDVIRTGVGTMLDDVSLDPRAYQPVVKLGRHGAAFFVPLRVPDGVAGTLMVAHLKGGGRFGQRSRQLVESLADAESVAINYDRAQSELRRLGLMEERERIAKELHDGIIQSLFAVGMSLQGTSLLTANRESSAQIARAIEELDRVITDLRNYIFGLRPGILADRRLDQALRELGADLQARTQQKVEVEVDAALAATLSARSADIVQLTREALSNVARHARATHTSLSLKRIGTKAVLSVQDNGVGFTPGNDSRGSGLRNMRERASKLGGTLAVDSQVGRGTRLRFEFRL